MALRLSMQIDQTHRWTPAPGFTGEALVYFWDGRLVARVLAWAPSSDMDQVPADWASRDVIKTATEFDAVVASLKAEGRAWAQAQKNGAAPAGRRAI